MLTPAMAEKKPMDPRLLKALQELGRVGGETRAKNLTAEQRRAAASKASRARWAKTKKRGS